MRLAELDLYTYGESEQPQDQARQNLGSMLIDRADYAEDQIMRVAVSEQRAYRRELRGLKADRKVNLDKLRSESELQEETRRGPKRGDLANEFDLHKTSSAPAVAAQTLAEKQADLLAAHSEWLKTSGRHGTQLDLRGADLCYADLRNTKLIGARLDNANLSEATFHAADLSDASLVEADLRNSNLDSADLRYALLTEAILSSTDLKGAFLCDADLRGADLRGADLTDIKGNSFDQDIDNLEDRHFEQDLSADSLMMPSYKLGFADGLRRCGETEQSVRILLGEIERDA